MIKKDKHSLKVFVFLLASLILSINGVFALDFDNVKTYDAETKTVTITNAFGFGDKIADIKLKSNLNENVGLGYQKVFEFEQSTYTDYQEFIKGFEIYNLKEGNRLENKDIELKYLTYTDLEVPDYKTICDEKNLTDCREEQVGTKIIQVEEWLPLEKLDAKVETLTISGWTDVKNGDYYEWIPNFGGVKVEEWATWAGNLSTGLIAYYKLDEASGSIIDSVGTYNATPTNYSQNVAGKINKAVNMSGYSFADVNWISTAQSYTFSFWANPVNETDVGDQQLFDSQTGRLFLYSESPTTNNIGFYDGAVSDFGVKWTFDSWNHYVVTLNAVNNNASLYKNGVLIASNTEYAGKNFGGTTTLGDDYSHTGNSGYEGLLDEFGVWGRVLTAAEIKLLYNNGTGCQYGNESCYGPPIIFENSIDYNSTTYDTAYESYRVNLTVNQTASLTAVTLEYAGTNYSMTNEGGGVWSYSRDLPSSAIGSNLLRFIYLYNGTSYYSANYTQNVSAIALVRCNATYQTTFLNLSFKDEATLGIINASIPLVEFDYYLGSGTQTRNYQNTNSTELPWAAFCGSVNRTFYVDPYVQYASSAYPQRIWNPASTNYSNSSTLQVLYLLSSSDGIYVTFQVVNGQDQLISGVEVTAVRSVGGVDYTVGTGTTGDDGTVTFWLNPDFIHNFTFSKTGFTTYSTSFAPTQSSYTVTLAGGGTTPASDYTRGIKTYVYPQSGQLYNDTAYTFAFNLTSSYWDVDSFGFNLRLSNGTIVKSASSTSTGTAASSSYNVGTQKIIYMDYYWIIEGNTTSGSRYWVVSNTVSTDWSIKHFFTKLNSYLTVGFFGLDDFGRYLIVFIVLFVVVGVMSYKYSLTSPIAVTTMIFLVIFFFDVVVNLVPTIRGIDNLLTYLAGLILAVTILKEVSQ